ncbi:MAG: hypothetical protein LBV74_18590 [Tannerella sp.]|nr:hypothetical protein [Tannerella sp.]
MKQKLLLLIILCVSSFTTQKMIAQTVSALNDTVYVVSEIPVPINVLKNDTYACSPLTITILNGPSNGTVTIGHDAIKGDTAIIYTSNTNYVGTDQLTYEIDCGGAPSSATVNIMVANTPDNMVYSDCYVLPPQTNWTIKEITPVSTNLVSTYGNLMVGDLDGDGTIEIIAQTDHQADYENPGMKIFNYDKSKLPGQNPLVLKKSFTLTTKTNNRGSCAIARYNGQGYLLVPGSDGYMYAYDINGTPLWKSDTQFKTDAEAYKVANVGVADFNNDGIPEVYAGATIYSITDGKQICKGSNNQGLYYYNIGIYSTFAVDIDGDGKLELLAGTQIYNVDIPSKTMSLKTGWQLPTSEFNKVVNYSTVPKEGQALAADIDGDGKLEVIVISRSTNDLRATVLVWKPQPDNRSVLVGSFDTSIASGTIIHSTPMIGNIDNTPTLEIIFITSNLNMYALRYDETKTQGSRIVQKWSLAHTDGSGATGATLFDFNQDGLNEIVYRDEKQLRIIDGSGATAVAKETFTNVFSGTVREYPVIADIDGDGHAEIIVTGQEAVAASTSPIRIFKSGDDSWAPAREVWNQYCYNIVNINEDLTVPRYQVSPAIKLGDGNTPYNAVLAQGTTISHDGVPLFITPNPVPDTITYSYNPSTDVLTVNVAVVNKGEAPLNAPVYASLYNDSYSTLIASGFSSTGANVGDTATVTITVNTASSHMPFGSLAIRINDNGTNYPIQAECDTTDNKLKSDIIFYQAFYDGNTSDGGTVPSDNRYYIVGNDVKTEQAGDMSLTDATFIGWTFTNPAPGIITSAGGVPADLMQPDSLFPNLVSDTTFYAVWAEDKRGTGGGPDSVPDYLQKEVFYNKTLATSGTEPVDNNLYNPNDSVYVKGNEGNMALTDATFIGWSFVNQTDTVKTAAMVPADLIQPTDSFEILQTDTTLYAVWAIDRTGPGGIPDSIPDYLQKEVFYNGTLATSGTVPVDGNLYNPNDSVTVKANEGNLALTDATFIGWSFTNQTDTIKTVAGIPADLIQPADSFEILQTDTTLYAVWAVDKKGPNGTPDSIPDYLQRGVTYDKTLATTGSAPVDGNLYSPQDSVAVKANEGNMALNDATFIGWSFTNQTDTVKTAAGIPADLVQPADSIEVLGATVLYAVWSEDKTGPGGIPDSIPDYLQYEVLYNKTLATSGAVPVDINLYNDYDSVVVKANVGNMAVTDATFIGWSFVNQTDTVKVPSDIPADLIQPADSFEIVSDTMLYAVWAIDRTGPGGIPDSVPDYLQFGVLYDKTLATGTEPVDGNLYNANDSAFVKGNEGVPPMTLTDATFIGWSYIDQAAIVTTLATVPADLIQPADSIHILSDTTLYAVWAEDKRGTGGGPDSVPDYLQVEVFYSPDIAAGTAPVDHNLYNPNDSVTVKGNEGSPQMTLTDACFMGWSFTAPGAIITSVAGIPADLIQPADSFMILTTDTTLYAVWGEDKTGPGGVPDSVPDFGQSLVTYNKTLATSGTEPTDGNLYNIGNTVTVKGNEGAMVLDSACFIGWSFVNQTAVIRTAAAVPADRKQPASTFNILTDTTLYAIWAEDKTGPGGIPDSVPDYLQFGVTYHGNTNTGGTVPVDINRYNTGGSVTVHGNTGMLEKTNTCFIGWSATQKTVITTAGDVPTDLKQGADIFTITSDTTFYAVWAEDNSGPGGVPDSIPDYLQFAVIYDGNGQTGGTEPVDVNLYNNGNTVTLFGNTGILERTNACFIGWSGFMHSLITTAAGVPSDLKQGADIFTITSDTTFYAVWAEDTNGPDGVPDSIPDCLQVKLTYHENSSHPAIGGALPSPNPTMPTMNTSAVIKGNTGGLYHAPADSLVFAGWTQTDGWPLVLTILDKPADLFMTGDVIPIGTTDIDLFAVWAYDYNGNGIPDYNEHSIVIVPKHTWPEKEDQGDPTEPGYYPTKPDWKQEYDEAARHDIYAGCEMKFIVTVNPDPFRDRTFTINYLGAWTKDMIVGADGRPLADSYTLPKNTATYVVDFSLLDVPADIEGQQGALEAVIAGGGRDTSQWMSLYNHPVYDLILVKPYLDVNNRIDLGITGGSPNLMRSINGYPWRNAYLPLTPDEQMAVYDGISIWLREPNGCWEEQFFFMTYIDPDIQRYVDLPDTEGVSTNPGVGYHYVKGHQDFTFEASYSGGTPLKVMAKGVYSGKFEELIGQDLEDGSYQYKIRQVVEPWTISFEPDPASGITGEIPVNGLAVWAYKNTLYIRSDSKERAYIYSMSGSLYKYLDIKEGDTKEVMNRGVYVVVIGNNRYKVIIK